MKYCSSCGKKITSTTSKFCGNCGEKIATHDSKKKKEGGVEKDHQEEAWGLKDYLDLYKNTLEKFVDFSGRSSRREYWNFYILNIIITFVVAFIEVFMGSDEGILSGLFQLFVILPSFSVGVRRMHDVGKSGWYLMIPIYNLVITLTNGNNEDNHYGSKPTK